MNLKLPRGMKLMPFQIEAVEKMIHFLNTNNGVYNACEMGLGKSAQSIVTINTLNIKKILIISPKAMLYTWIDEIKKWSDVRKIRVLETGRTPYPLDDNGYTIVSYNIAVTRAEEFMRKGFQCIIFDEAHYLKNPDAKRTQVLISHLFHAIPKRICLTGTPFTKSIADCWPLFYSLCPEHMEDRWHFLNKFTNQFDNGYAIEYRGIKNEDVLYKRIRKHFFLRYLKVDHLPELPDKQFQCVHLPQKYMVKGNKNDDALKEKYVALLMDAIVHDWPPPPPPPALATLLREQGEKKVEAVVEFVKELLAQEIPVVMFAVHRSVIAALTEALSAYDPAVIHGGVSGADRRAQVDKFQAGETLLFIGNYVAAGVGITLTRSSTVVLAEMTYNPAELLQAVDRVHRIGQKKSVIVYNCLVTGSKETRIVDAVVSKVLSFDKVLL